MDTDDVMWLPGKETGKRLPDKEWVKGLLSEAGVYRAAVARIDAVDPSAVGEYRRWIAEGCHGSMEYLEKYDDVRSDPRLLLEGAKSIICCTFNYHTADTEHHTADGLKWAEYALGDDYHDVVRRRLSGVAARLTEETGAACRVCVDTAPLRERYWAVKSGLGFIGLNNQLIIPGAGSRFFLGEILTTLDLEPDTADQTISCGECGRCLAVCPGNALTVCHDGRVRLDGRRCLSYLTIEHRGALPPATDLGKHVYGCDECQRVCPHNRMSPLTDIEEFNPRREILELDAERIMMMSQEEFSVIFRRSAIKRTKLSGIQRNAEHIIRHKPD